VSRFILIIGQSSDPHVERVRQALDALGARSLIVDPQLSDPQISISFSGGECRFEARAGGRVIVGSEISAVWWRLKPGPEWPASDPELNAMRVFRGREWQHALEGLEVALPDARWVNPRSADRRARQKALQLREAARAGFAIPPTFMSNDPSKLTEQIQSWGERAIYKPFTPYFPAADKAVFTNRIDSSLIKSNEESVRLAPGIFQALIEKAYELRITLVGETIFAVRIESQQSATTRLDWRRDYDALSYSEANLSPAMEQDLLRLHKELGLVFGAYDFIVTPNGQYIFLEVNPVGQWLWLEDAIGVGISRALAELLARPDGRGVAHDRRTSGRTNAASGSG
jgi:glutathione synthase/RimK-type ligase-like ATP-grasp enzyme